MNFSHIFRSFVCLLPCILAACAAALPKTADTTAAAADTQIYWVSGHKAECSAGAGKMMCLRVSKHPDLNRAEWQYFYAPIEGFTFEEGVLKKIEVHAAELDPATVPADASSIRYRLIRTLETKADTPARYR